MAQQTLPQPPPLEVKKSNPWKIATLLLIIVLIAMGIIIGLLWTGQVIPSSEYTKVKVLSDGVQRLNVSGQGFIITYNWMGHSAWNGTANIQNPIEVQLVGSNIDRILNPVRGTYNIAGFEVVVSEVYEDYIIVLVKPL